MRIAVFIDWFAPAYKAGGPIQSIVNLVNQPIEGMEYRVVCSNKDVDGKVLEGVRFDEWVRFNPQTKVWYCSNGRNVGSAAKELSAWGAEIFFINGLYSLYYNLIPILVGRSKKIISARGMLHPGALSQKGMKKRLYLRLWKVLNLHRRHSFHATNAEEERYIRGVFGESTKIHVAQNLPRKMLEASFHPTNKTALELVSIGLISPMKNYLHVLNSLSGCGSPVNYTIYGAVKDAAYWEECRAAIEKLPANVTVEYRGDLASALVPGALSKSHVFILPSKSENFGHALYEALAAGLPVITSHNTPWNGLEAARAGFNVAPEDHYELSKAICFFATANDAELATWSAGAKAYADAALDVDRIRMQYLRMFQA